MLRDNQVYADAIMLAYCGVDLMKRVERERLAFATALKKRTTFLASHRDTRRSRKRAQAPKAEPESFGAKLTAAIKSRLARLNFRRGQPSQNYFQAHNLLPQLTAIQNLLARRAGAKAGKH